MPRTFEYLEAVGRNPVAEFPCLPTGTDGGGAGLADAKAGKALHKCDKELQKAILKLLKVAAKFGQTCSDVAAKCQQQKPDDPKCLPKARTKCQKSLNKMFATLDKLQEKVAKKCDDFSSVDLQDGMALGLSAVGSRCKDLVGTIDTLPDLVECLGRDALCEATNMGEKQAPRLQQYEDLLDVLL